jgi:hypothetical protein
MALAVLLENFKRKAALKQKLQAAGFSGSKPIIGTD